jgi:hypothetical protein
MRLLDFIEEHDGIGAAADRFSQLAGLVVAHVAGGAPIMRDTLCFSWYSDMSIRTIACSSSNMNSARARASSVLPTPVGPRKMKLPSGRFGVLQSGARAADRIRDRANRLLLADDALMQALFHLEELLDFAFHQPADRNAGPLADDFGDVLLVDLFLQHALGLLQFASRASWFLISASSCGHLPYCSSDAFA